VFGFARTLSRTDLEAPTDRYVGMIEAASQQMGELLDELSLVARIGSGRFEPRIEEVDSLELVRSAAAELEEGRVEVTGEGATVNVPAEEMRRALSQLTRAAGRHGGFDSVGARVDGATVAISPVTGASGPVLVGEQLRDFGAAAAAELVRALGGSVEVEDDRLVVRLPV
jgi:signal transduction histidine kinase